MYYTAQKSVIWPFDISSRLFSPGPSVTCSLGHRAPPLINQGHIRCQRVNLTICTRGKEDSESEQVLRREDQYIHLSQIGGFNMQPRGHQFISRAATSRLAFFRNKIQLFGRVIARRGRRRGGAVLFLMKGRKTEGGVYSCSGYERYHRRKQGDTDVSKIKSQSSALSSNSSTTPHTFYPLLQANYSTEMVQENSLLEKNSVWDVTLEEEVLT